MKAKTRAIIAMTIFLMSLCLVSCKKEKADALPEVATEYNLSNSQEGESDSTESVQEESLEEESSSSSTSSQEESSVEESSAEESSSEAHEHAFEEWKHDAFHHWKVCNCGEGEEKEGHSYRTGICADCGRTNIVFALSADESYYIVRDWQATEEVLEVPAEYQGKAVKEIGAGAFAGQSVKEILLPDSIEKIGATAFANCASLQRVKIGAGVKFIASRVFDGCTALTKVEFSITEGWTSGGRAIPSQKLATAEEAAGYLKGEDNEDIYPYLLGMRREEA